MADTDAIRQIVNDYEDTVSSIEADDDLKDEAKARRILALNDKVLEDYGRARKELADAFDSERTAIEAKIGGTSAGQPKDTQTELRAMRSELAARDVLDSGHAGAIFEGYQQAVADSNEAAMGVYERRGPSKLTDLRIPLSERQRLEGMISESREARMTPEQRAARDDLAAFDKRRDSDEQGLALSQDTLLNRVRSRNDFYRYGSKDAS